MRALIARTAPTRDARIPMHAWGPSTLLASRYNARAKIVGFEPLKAA